MQDDRDLGGGELKSLFGLVVGLVVGFVVGRLPFSAWPAALAVVVFAAAVAVANDQGVSLWR